MLGILLDSFLTAIGVFQFSQSYAQFISPLWLVSLVVRLCLYSESQPFIHAAQLNFTNLFWRRFSPRLATSSVINLMRLILVFSLVGVMAVLAIVMGIIFAILFLVQSVTNERKQMRKSYCFILFFIQPCQFTGACIGR